MSIWCSRCFIWFPSSSECRPDVCVFDGVMCVFVTWPTFTHVWIGMEDEALRAVTRVTARRVPALAVLTQVSVHHALVHVWNTHTQRWRRRLRVCDGNVCRDTDPRRFSRWCPPRSPYYSYTCMFRACSRTRRSYRYQDPAHTRLYLTQRETFTFI